MNSFIKNTSHLLCACTLGAATALTGCAVNPVSGKHELALMTESQEIALGRSENPKIIKTYGAYDDASLQDYVNKVGQKLAHNSHRTDLEYHFTVLDSTDVNAFALPGGYVYITRGLLAYLNSEAELAAVLGHEIGHVTARHAVRQMSAAQVTSLGFAIGSIFVPELQTAGAQDLINVLGTAMLRGYGREHELEADRLGAQYLARAHYDPEAMIEVIRVLKAQEEFERQRAKEEGREPNVYHGVFATHPDNDQRLHEVVDAAREFGNGTKGADNRAAFLTMEEGLVFGPGAKQGVLRHNHFYHKVLGFGVTFPAGWLIDDQPDWLLAKSPDGKAVMRLSTAKIEKGLPPERFMRQSLKVSTLRDGRTLPLDGLETYTAIARLTTDQGARDGRVSVIYYGGLAYVIDGITKEDSDLVRYDEQFLSVARSFHKLLDKEKPLAEPLKLTIRKATAADTFSTLAKTSQLPDHAEERLRLLNGKYPDGEPVGGEPVKLVK